MLLNQPSPNDLQIFYIIPHTPTEYKRVTSLCRALIIKRKEKQCLLSKDFFFFFTIVGRTRYNVLVTKQLKHL